MNSYQNKSNQIILLSMIRYLHICSSYQINNILKLVSSLISKAPWSFHCVHLKVQSGMAQESSCTSQYGRKVPQMISDSLFCSMLICLVPTSVCAGHFSLL